MCLHLDVGGGIALEDERLARTLLSAGTSSAGLTFLGVEASGTPLFADTVAHRSGVAGVREALARLDAEESAIASYAAALVGWHAASGHCVRCGAAAQLEAAGHQRRCSACGAVSFPRTDPVVMVLPTSGTRCLLGRRHGGRERTWSPVAGFVEAGESFEDAAHRETLEETGVTIARTRYVTSQAWPFPGSLMTAFIGEADEAEAPDPAPGEFDEARWFTRPGLRQAVRTDSVRLPPTFTIARTLVDRWLTDAAPSVP